MTTMTAPKIVKDPIDPLTALKIPGLVIKRKMVDDDISMYRVVVYPDAARYLLDHNIANNRTPNNRKVTQLASDMAEGRWYVSNDCGRITRAGAVDNMQHRCIAGVRADYAFEIFLQVVDPDYASRSMLSMDKGKPRTLADSLKLEGYTNTGSVASLSTLITRYDRGLLPNYKAAVSDSDVMDFIRSVPPESLYASIIATSKILRAGTKVSPAGLGMVLFIAERLSSTEDVTTFVDEVVRSEGLYEGDPLYALQRYAAKIMSTPVSQRPGSVVQAANFVEVWNRWLEGDTLKKCNWSLRRGFPVILGR